MLKYVPHSDSVKIFIGEIVRGKLPNLQSQVWYFLCSLGRFSRQFNAAGLIALVNQVAEKTAVTTANIENFSGRINILTHFTSPRGTKIVQNSLDKAGKFCLPLAIIGVIVGLL